MYSRMLDLDETENVQNFTSHDLQAASSRMGSSLAAAPSNSRQNKKSQILRTQAAWIQLDQAEFQGPGPKGGVDSAAPQ